MKASKDPSKIFKVGILQIPYKDGVIGIKEVRNYGSPVRNLNSLKERFLARGLHRHIKSFHDDNKEEWR